MPRLSEQIERIADAAFAETSPVGWAAPAVEPGPSRHRRSWMLIAASLMLVSLVAGLVVAVREVDPDPVTPVDTSSATRAPATSLPVDTTSPSTAPVLVPDSGPPSSTPSEFGPGPDPDDWESPYSRAIEQAVGFPLGVLATGLRRTEQRAVIDCVNAGGWTMTEADLDWVRTDTLDVDFYPADGTVASTELFNDERGQRVERATLRRDAGFETVLSDCTAAQDDVAPDLRNLLSNGGLPSFDVGNDPAYLTADAEFEECLGDLGLTKDSLETSYFDLSDAAFEESARLDGGPAARSAAVEALEGLDRQQRELRDRVAPCVDPIARTETELVFQRQIEFLDENPGYIDDVVLDSISVPAVQASIDDIGSADDRVELIGRVPVIDLSISVEVPTRLGDWTIETFDDDPSFDGSEPRLQPTEDPTFLLLPPEFDDPNKKRLAFTPDFDEQPEDLDQRIEQLPQRGRTGDSEPRLVDIESEGVSVVAYESTLVDVISGRTVPAVNGYVTTRSGQVFSIDARDIGVDTVIQIALTLQSP